MRIEKIEIKGFFGMFNHSIDLNQEKHLTVIYGINGIGKTTIFKILNFFYNKNFRELIKAPFKELKIIYDDNFFSFAE